MSFLFGTKKTVDQQIREKIRLISRACRNVDTEIRRLETENNKLVLQIKKLAKQNEMNSVRTMARQIAAGKKSINGFKRTRTTLQVIGSRLTAISCTNTMGQTMKGITKVMQQINAGMKPAELQKVLMAFEKESGLLEAKEEMMMDAVDDVMEDDELDSEDVVNSVLEELGIEINDQLAGLPTPAGSKGAAATPARTAVPASGPDAPPGNGAGSGALNDSIAEDDLEARLARLKRG